MKVNVSKANTILKVIAVIIIVSALVSCIWLNDAQRIVVGGGLVLGLLNLLMLYYFFNKNTHLRK